MQQLKTVFWDLDGTIADTELTGHRVAFNQAFNKYSLDWNWSKDEYIQLLHFPGGRNRIKQYALLKGHTITDEQIKSIHQSKKYNYIELVRKGSIKIRPGVIRLLKELKENNVKQWIVTSSGKSSVKALLEAYKLNTFSGYVTSELVQLAKPSPECYIKALELSKSSTRNSIAIEDSIEGLRSASLANLNCIVTLSPWSKYKDSLYKAADIIVDHLGDYNKPSYIFKGLDSTSIIDYRTLENLLKKSLNG
ncbi:HAD-IA family hydrolase [Prochlorococcus marinus]|uniref:Putative CbbY-like protein n=1 Tax=Prochlorococcus marinus (strain MIT 9211) TaxID=93059 RepID=A9BAH8_PROM4|nr:HAD-IA family hydrolase [Prochlorococcus marinus]ABX08840.1 Putative CbbY-like protein [Prochlorococcus marinus str. MIT 9211]